MPDTAPSRRILSQAKKDKKYIDMCCGKSMKSMLLMCDGKVIGCALSPQALYRRLNHSDMFGYEEGE